MSPAKRPLLIGTRGSPLALWQAEHVRNRLLADHGLDDGAIELAIISTSGDRIADKPLRDLGGKGLFTKEIDEAQLAGRIDIAVHSMKDLPTVLPEGLMVGAVLKRGDVRDAFISAKGVGLRDLPAGAVVGSSSLRRQAQIRRLRPDLEVIDFRGNVETRLAKLARGVADATLLAFAGLDRLGLKSHVTEVMPVTEMLPAVAQGAIAVACRNGDIATRNLLDVLNDKPTATAVTCERAFLAELDGSCRTPIAGLAELDGGTLVFRGLVLKPDGSDWHLIEETGPASEASRLGTEAGRQLLERAGSDFLASLSPR